MRAALWPDASLLDLAAELDALLADPDQVVFVAARASGTSLCGFIEARVRAFANGVDEAPCACVEGWWVDPDMRRSGVGAALMSRVEAWARARGFHELGSDTLQDNVLGQQAHTALGFEERERTRALGKSLAVDCDPHRA